MARRRLVAAVVNWLLGAGAGQLALGRWRAAVGFLLLDAILWTGMIVAALACRPRLFWSFALLLGAVRLVASLATFRRLPDDREPSWGRVGALWAALVLVGLAQASVVRGGLLEAFKLPAGSMLPTLEIGDHVLVDRRPRPIGRGDVIVFQYPRDPSKDFIKRVVAVGGDTVALVGDALVINGRPVATTPRGVVRYPDLDEVTGRWADRAYQSHDETLEGRTYRVLVDDGTRPSPGDKSFIVPAEHVFVLGDNRDNSHDSRYWGSVPLSLVKGRALFVFWSRGPAGVRWARIGRILE